MTIWTIGHSTRSREEFLGLLSVHGIERLADIRRFPTSRWQQFKQENLRASLTEAGIEYVHIAELGGYRRGGYPAHTQTAEFAAGLTRLLESAAEKRTVMMCAEAVFFRCHRRWVADALVIEGHDVLHITGPGKARVHLATVQLPLEGVRPQAPPTDVRSSRTARRTNR